MNNLLPTTIEGWNAKKRRFMALYEKEQPWSHMAHVYENAISYCDRKALELKGMYRKVFLMVVLVNVLVLLSILASGCGKMMRGTGLIFEGLGDGVVAGGQHLQDSTSQEK